MVDPDSQAGPSDVAMFIDWENMHGFIRGKANISALREVAESYGRLVLAKAYADWREHRFQQDSLVLYKIGVEPIYVPHAPAGGKNNVDVKLATDCIDFAHRYPAATDRTAGIGYCSPGCQVGTIRVNGGLQNRGDGGRGFKILPIFYPKKPKNMNLGGNSLNLVPIETEIEGFESLFSAQARDILRG